VKPVESRNFRIDSRNQAIWFQLRMLGDAIALGSIPVTWVTDYSGDMGNTVGPNGFSIGSRRQVSSSKYPIWFQLAGGQDTRQRHGPPQARSAMLRIGLPTTSPISLLSFVSASRRRDSSG